MAIIADPLGANKNTQNTTAHEFAHILNATDSELASQKKDLMYHNADTTNPCHLRRYDWNIMNHPPIPVIFVPVSPDSGPPGTTVSISGANFGATPGQVSLNGISATVQSWIPGTDGYADIITFVVPSNATSGPIQVTASNGLLSSNSPTFTVTTP